MSGLTRAWVEHNLPLAAKQVACNGSHGRGSTDTEASIGTRPSAPRGDRATTPAIAPERSRCRAVARAGDAALRVIAVIAVIAAASLGCAGRGPVVVGSRAPEARVAWVQGDRAYLATADSLEWRPGDRLTFLVRGKRIAAGEVARVVDEGLAVARIRSGSLQRVKHLDRVRLVAERPVLEAPPLLRVGFPAPGRSSGWLACAAPGVRPPSPAGAYRAEALSEHAIRMVREPGAAMPAPWPDTLLVRLFDESADQEIAFERGELDLAVFWPGEASAHVRELPLWGDALLGTRSRGAFAASSSGPGALDGIGTRPAADDSVFAALNREVFRDDLAPWRVSSPGAIAAAAGRPRYEVDPSCPGREAIERALHRARRSPGGAEAERSVRLYYLDAPVGALRDSGRTDILFAIRCPILVAPGMGRTVRALGGDALADMMGCDRAGRDR